MHDFQGYYSRTFQDQNDFPGLSRYWNFQEEKIWDFPGVVGTVDITMMLLNGRDSLSAVDVLHACCRRKH